MIDPYNDFISEGGKVWNRLKPVAEANGCVPHMLQVLNVSRNAGVRVSYALHHRYRRGDYETWKYIAPIQQAAWAHKTFEYGTWGGEIRPEFTPRHGDIVALEQWSPATCQHRSGFSAEDAWCPSAHCGRPCSAYVRGGHRTLCRRTWIPGHDGERRDGELFRGAHARRSRRQHPELRERRCRYGGDCGFAFCSLSLAHRDAGTRLSALENRFVAFESGGIR